MSQDEFIQLKTQSKLAVLLRKLRVALTPSWLPLTTTLANGIRIQGQNKAGWGGRGVYIFREDIEPELALLPKLVPKGGVLLDIGANVGIYTLTASKVVGPDGTVIAIEPFPDIFGQLYNNIKLNAVSDVVRARNLCMSDSTGVTKFWMNRDMPNSFSINREGDATGLSVLSVRLDDLMQWENITRLDYIKIDAEGAEERILDGGQSALKRFRPIVQVEDIDRKICKLLRSYAAFGVARTRNTLLIPNERLDQAISLLGSSWERIN
jgi:FkbM family methyltransferase